MKPIDIQSVLATQKSKIKGVGILDPGPINNLDLFDTSEEPSEELGDKHNLNCIKLGLNTNQNWDEWNRLPYSTSSYTVVSESEWNFLWTHYGGGPIIKRKDCDIYSEPLDVTDESFKQEEVRLSV